MEFLQFHVHRNIAILEHEGIVERAPRGRQPWSPQVISDCGLKYMMNNNDIDYERSAETISCRNRRKVSPDSSIIIVY